MPVGKADVVAKQMNGGARRKNDSVAQACLKLMGHPAATALKC